MMSPSLFLFDHDEVERTGVLVVKCKLPFSNLTSLEGAEKQRWLDSGEMAEFSHSLDTLIGGHWMRAWCSSPCSNTDDDSVASVQLSSNKATSTKPASSWPPISVSNEWLKLRHFAAVEPALLLRAFEARKV